MDFTLKALECPISKELMNDPVILIETGKTYNRSSILEWYRICLSKGQPITDPISNVILTNVKFIENWVIRDLLPTTVPIYKTYPFLEPIDLNVNEFGIEYSESEIEELCKDVKSGRSNSLDTLEDFD